MEKNTGSCPKLGHVNGGVDITGESEGGLRSCASTHWASERSSEGLRVQWSQSRWHWHPDKSFSWGSI